MKLYLMSALIVFTLTACTSPNLDTSTASLRTTYEKPTPVKEEAYFKTRKLVGLSTKNDSNYKSFRSDLDTVEKKELFNNLMYRLWDRQITRDQFIAQGVAAFPTHRYEFIYIANAFQRYS